MEAELFNSKFKFPQALQNFEIDSEDIYGTEDPLSAIAFAAKLPFRTGVSKSIIVLPCSECFERSSSYAEVQKLLLQRDIRLHVLKQHDFELKTPGKETSYIFGADGHGVYTNKHVGDNELKGDSGLRLHLRMPKDLCVALTEETGGSISNSRKLINGKAVGQKKFLDVLSRVYAKKAAPSECQICECQPDEAGVGMPVCKSCSAPSLSYWKPSFLPSVKEEAKQFESDLKEYLKKPAKPNKKKLRMLKTKKFKKFKGKKY